MSGIQMSEFWTEIVIAEFIEFAYGLFKRIPSEDDCKREVFFTPFRGCYGTAGHLFTINGSPVRVVMVITKDQMVAMYQDRIVRGSPMIGNSAAGRRRYIRAAEWAERACQVCHITEDGGRA